jgi:2,4-diketo-3-deoxy-L-fuconate hydrolase
MAVTVVRYLLDKTICWGVVDGQDIIPAPQTFETTADFLRGTTPEGLKMLSEPRIALERVRILSPVTRNQRFVCQGANYRQHMIESGLDPDAKHYNMIFTKASSCIVPADADVVRPRRVRFLDYEVELGLVLRRDITGPVTVTQDNLFDFVAGAVIVNDYSARDIQIPETQFHKGKSFRTFGPVGPFLCLFEREDMPALKDLELSLRVNGQVRQQDSTRNLVFGPEETLTELSGVHDFAAGDLLATGTPAGCALAVPSPARQRLGALLPEAMKWKIFFKIQAKRSQYLQPGDVVETRIRSADGRIDLGVQRNRIVAEGEA